MLPSALQLLPILLIYIVNFFLDASFSDRFGDRPRITHTRHVRRPPGLGNETGIGGGHETGRSYDLDAIGFGTYVIRRNSR